MTIKEYFNDYNRYKKYQVSLPMGKDECISDFFDNCISKTLLDKDNVLAWHKMFMEYINLPDAIFWIRYYENGNKNSGRWNTRRAARTSFSDNFSYVFVSNFDVHEIYNMISLGVKPDINEFLNLMKKHEYRLHYDNGKSRSCEEADIAAYPLIGNIRAGVLTEKKWYLAHICDIKSEFLRSDGYYYPLTKEETSKIFPRGSISDWHIDNSLGVPIRNLNYSLSNEEKELVKAHFLRFVDPLNYFLVPGKKYEKNIVNSCIGEYKPLTNYIRMKYIERYGKECFAEFEGNARISFSKNKMCNDVPINISYGINIPPKKDALGINNISSDVKYKRQKVKHRRFGEGEIVCIKDNSIKVLFEVTIHEFSYPDSLQNGELRLIQPENYFIDQNTGKREDTIVIDSEISEVITSKNVKDFCIKKGISIDTTVTFSSSNRSESRTYWATPNINVLNKDWTLILNDKIEKNLYIFRIPAGTIKEWQLKTRKDNKLDLQIFYGDKNFQDSRSYYVFAPYHIKTINY